MKSYQFQDRKGRTYMIALTLRRAREIQNRLPIDITSEEHWKNLVSSRADQLAYIWYLIEDQAKEYDLDIDSWEQAMYGEGVASEACGAFMRALVNFYQNLDLTKLATVTKAAEKLRKADAERFADKDKIKSLLESL